MTAREHGGIGAVPGEPAESLVALFARCDAYRKPERFVDMLLALECATLGGDYPQRSWLLGALGAARGVNAGEVAARCGADKAGIPAAVLAARVAAVRAWMGQSPSTPP